jgi:hypothetical protein
MHTTFWSENLKGRNHSEDLVVDVWMTLKWEVDDWINLFQLLPVAGSCEHGNGPSISI